MRALSCEVVQRRFTQVVEPFARSQLATFLSAVKDTNGIITGSAARAMVNHDESYPMRDLNIIVPHNEFGNLHATIKDMLGFTPISRMAHPAIAPCISKFQKYAFHERFITLSASHEHQSVLHIILNAPTTADMLFMTTGGVCYFYPKWFEAGLAIASHTGNLVPWNNKLGCAGELMDDIEVLEKGTDFLRTSCGRLCPTFWHHIEQKHLRLSVDWNTEDSVTNIVHNVDVEWRLNVACMNWQCPHHISVMSGNFEGSGARSREFETNITDRQERLTGLTRR